MSNGLGGDAFTKKNIISPLTLMLGQGQTGNFAQYPLHHMTYAPAKFEVATCMSNGLGGNAFIRNIKVTLNAAQYPLHHVTYSATKFEVATSYCLGGDTFTRNMTDRETTD